MYRKIWVKIGLIDYFFSYGLYVVTCANETKYNGLIANVVFQITSEPIRIAIAINRENLSHQSR